MTACVVSESSNSLVQHFRAEDEINPTPVNIIAA